MTATDYVRDAPDLHDVPDTDEAREAWRIGGLREATWAMRKLADIEARRAQVRDAYQAEVDRLDVWVQEQEQRLDHDGDFFRAHLEVYALTVRADSPVNSKGEPTVKSVSTPYGVVKTSVRGGSWAVSEETVEWAKRARPDLVTTTVSETFQVSAAKALADLEVVAGEVIDTTTGEAVPGIVVAPKVVGAKVVLADPAGAR